MSQPKVSILITAWKEAASIGKTISTILDGYTGTFELLLAIPDQETIAAALQTATELGIVDRVWISDLAKDGKPQGKPKELGYLMDHAKGEYWIFGDGDVFYGKNVINELLAGFTNDSIWAVTGRPKSADSKDNMMSYYGHLLTEAAHHKRMIDLAEHTSGHGKQFVRKRPFFPVSGYIFAMKANDQVRPVADTLVEDAYMSYLIHNLGKKIAYQPQAEVYVKFPTNLDDYFKQKKRSVGGYIQLWKYGIVTKETNSRSFGRELEYFWFPISYASNLRELLWSVLLYPIRLYLWLVIFWERKILRKDFFKTWVRVESTK